MSLTLAIPSKGRLMEATQDWFAARGVALQRSGGAREYAAESDLPGLSVQLLSAGEIAGAVARGDIHLGVTGRDLVRETIPLWETRAEEMAPLGFGHADLIIAVPSFWTDVTTLSDLDAVAAQFRRNHGHRLRIATKYHRLVREHLRTAGVADYALVDSQGATEGVVANETAEAIADITSTGETLRANHLRPLDEEPVLRSEAVLFRSVGADWGEAAMETLERLNERLGSLPRP